MPARGFPLVLFRLFLVLAGALASNPAVPVSVAGDDPAFALVIHGGSGTMQRSRMDAETEAAYRHSLDQALLLGEKILADGGASLDAVEQVIRFLEDDPLFNAGKGAVFTAEGRNELDASIMDGGNLDAGSVAGVRSVRHPISAARAVMTDSPHVMLAGEGAEAFAAAQGLEIVAPEFFWTQRRWDSFQRQKNNQEEHEEAAAEADHKHGTVGCVALDTRGNIAAGTSTGGMTMKRWGRIGDSPVIGAGTWADNSTCGVSATGHGEFFIRNAVAHDIAARMEHGGASLQDAAEQVVLVKLKAQEADGGIIALDRNGNVAMVFNTRGMYRGYAKSSGERGVFIFGDE